ncbi:glutamate-5-semialdehyde dehydrogenase [uncultured Duncaniella sp.]|uniref:glutamate-5-semialdehyde dehydrogenase n=2 Tax=uncultured Duncaniella sp. TaxID=2768039 RepID=UPI002674C887|nr:glutamate-5-semialdehyde dehydrogenase [uncultured Duncaniella sp.]MCI9172722.1 glutamate-5-semialdehyde dehydrogenase [Muribaculaceae bacterium]
MPMTEIFKKVREASRTIANISDRERNEVLLTLAGLLEERSAVLLEANARDLALMDRANPLYDRLQLTPERIGAIASDMRNVAGLPSPVGEEIERRTLPNGILLRRVRVPFGVIGVIYEARPNVTFDVFSLCFKSGNACILKGGKDAEQSNMAAISIIHEALRNHGISPDVAVMLPATHEATAQLLNAVGYVDVCIPRGGRRLIDFVRDNARVPVIETGAGVVHAYFDSAGDPAMGRDIVANAKTRRVSVCNALDTLLIHRDRLGDLPALCEPLAGKNVEIHADPEALTALSGHYPEHLLIPAVPEDWDREWMDYKMGLRTVASVSEAISHIAEHGSGHSECIITGSDEVAGRFQAEVDASCVYVNAPTSFTDGAQFGLGAEIGISTQKLGPRGPMGLREITTYRYLLTGSGQTRG